MLCTAEHKARFSYSSCEGCVLCVVCLDIEGLVPVVSLIQSKIAQHASKTICPTPLPKPLSFDRFLDKPFSSIPISEHTFGLVDGYFRFFFMSTPPPVAS